MSDTSPEDQETLVRHLRQDLEDGGNLARAALVVADTVEHRIGRLERLLDLLDEDEVSEGLHRRVDGMVSRYRAALVSTSDAVQATIDDYQPQLERIARRLEQSET